MLPIARLRTTAARAAALAVAILAAWAGPCIPSPVRAEGARAPAELLAAVEQRYASLGSLVADFTQVYRSVGLGQEVTERGKLYVRRPGLMRWDYREPERKAFLVEAVRDEPGMVETLSYVPADLTAVRGRVAVAEAPHLQLLLGQGRLDDGFAATDVRLKEPRDPAARHLRLVPRRPLQSVEVVYLEVDEARLAVQRVLVVDALGNESDLVLEKVREGARVKDSVFDTRLPAGVTVRDARQEP